MKKIKLFNRDGADLWLEKIEEVEQHISKWKLKVDEEHSYCLEYLRVIGTPLDRKVVDIEAIDPSGGPYIPLGGILKGEDNKYYEIVKFINSTTLLLSERNNDN